MGNIVALFAIAGSTAAIFAYLIFIWWLDRYEREPIWIVGLTFLWGGVGGTCLGCFLTFPGTEIAAAFDLGLSRKVLSTVFVAPLSEEFTKGLVLIPLVLTSHFDNETDGLIYGAAAGLGFAATENLLYYVQAFEGGAGAVIQLVIMRTLFSSLVHCISSALLGMSVGYARHRSGTSRWIVYPLIGYGLAVINHGVWNGAATAAGMPGVAGSASGLIMTAAIGIVVLAAILMFVITQWSLSREHDVIRQYLEKEAEQGTLPAGHADIIPYWLKRRKSGWLSPNIPKDEYVRAATLLAFRHYQLEIAEGERRQQYRDDIEAYRAELQAMQQKA